MLLIRTSEEMKNSLESVVGVSQIWKAFLKNLIINLRSKVPRKRKAVTLPLLEEVVLQNPSEHFY